MGGLEGPAWFLVYLVWSVDNVSFTSADISARLAHHGFTGITAQPLVHEVTTVLSAPAPA